MDFLNAGVPLGRFAGITVRVHFTFLIFVVYWLSGARNLWFAAAVVAGLYFCILLHEFGHALSARWCDGEANDILLWPLGGLAHCRPAFHPTSHLITTVAGPFVTLVLWLGLAGLARLLLGVARLPDPPAVVFSPAYFYMENYVEVLSGMNRFLLLFNLIPAFPMDGGRMLRDTMWHWMSAEKATLIAVRVSQVAAIGMIAWGLYRQSWWLIFIAVFVLMQAVNEQVVVGYEAAGTYGFSLRERLRRGKRQRAFYQGVRAQVDETEHTAFHQCAVCGRTDRDDPHMDFRVCGECSGGQEYCPDHLPDHSHV